MSHRVTISDELHAAVRATGLPLSEIVRRGLDNPCDTARHAAAETRLAQLEERVAQLEAAGALAGHWDGADEFDPEEWTPPTPEEQEEFRRRVEEQRTAARRRDAARFHAQLVDNVGAGSLIDSRGAARAWQVPDYTARSRLTLLDTFGLAERQEGGGGGSQPFKWLITESPAGSGAELA